MLLEVSGFSKSLKFPWSEENRKFSINKLSKAKLADENIEFCVEELSRLLEVSFEFAKNFEIPIKKTKFLGKTQFFRSSCELIVVFTVVGTLEGKSKLWAFIGVSKKNHERIFWLVKQYYHLFICLF